MKDISTLTLGEIVKQNYKAAAIFEKFELDLNRMGNQNFNDACHASNVDPALVIHELERLETAKVNSNDFDSWSLEVLVDYICKKHHAYVEEKTPQLKEYLDQICQLHGSHHPELSEIRAIFFQIGDELTANMRKEELLLFPFIKKLEAAKHTKTPVSSPLFGSVINPVGMMKIDHAEEGEKFKRIATLANNYRFPSDASITFSVTYQLLEEYEKDLRVHIHLENDILFPKAIALEEQCGIISFL